MLATDGLWDTVESAECESMAAHRGAVQAAHFLSEAARRRKARPLANTLRPTPYTLD